MRYLSYLLPWQFSPTVLAVRAAAIAPYVRGLVVLRHSGSAPGFWRPLVFFLGAHIALVPWPLRSIYAVCGRVGVIGPPPDQQTGGRRTWIPAAMISAGVTA